MVTGAATGVACITAEAEMEGAPETGSEIPEAVIVGTGLPAGLTC